MQVNIASEKPDAPVNRGYVVNMVIKSFKGYKDVEIHLYRPTWNAQEEKSYDWEKLLGSPLPQTENIDPSGSRKTLLETFSREERDIVVEYLKDRYHSRLKSINSRQIDFPIPIGLAPLSDIPEKDGIGRIRFEEIPNYPLEFVFHGIYYLKMHERIEQDS